jgi:hypothetical protein
MGGPPPPGPPGPPGPPSAPGAPSFAPSRAAAPAAAGAGGRGALLASIQAGRGLKKVAKPVERNEFVKPAPGAAAEPPKPKGPMSMADEMVSHHNHNPRVKFTPAAGAARGDRHRTNESDACVFALLTCARRFSSDACVGVSESIVNACFLTHSLLALLSSLGRSPGEAQGLIGPSCGPGADPDVLIGGHRFVVYSTLTRAYSGHNLASTDVQPRRKSASSLVHAR